MVDISSSAEKGARREEIMVLESRGKDIGERKKEQASEEKGGAAQSVEK
jgi:hypothetical protein